MSKYDNLAKVVIEAIGGKENVTYFQHCTTRLRFNVKDRSSVDVNAIEKADHVLGTQWSVDELQIIIGPAVADAYEVICNLGGFVKEEAIDDNLDKNLKKEFSIKTLLSGILDSVSGSITPIIPMMIGGGMIKVFTMLLNMLGVLSAESTTYLILTWLGDAFMYFFPIYLGATSAKKFGANQGVGMLLGGLLIYPSFIAAVNEGATLSIFGLPVYMSNYASSVIPIIVSVWVLSKVEKFISKHCPDILKSFAVPTLSLLVMVPIMLVVTAPLGQYLGVYITAFVNFIYETIGFVGVGVLATLLPLMVLTGMHTLMTPYWVNAFATLGYDTFFLPAMIISNWNQAVACAAVALKTKNKDIKSSAFSCAITAFIGGVTEPAMFGVTVRYKTPLYAAMIGNFIGGAIAGLLKVAAYAMPGSGGVFAFAVFAAETSNLMFFFIAAIVGMIATFILTYFLGIKENA